MKKNAQYYFLKGFCSFVNGKMYANRQREIVGSWQNQTEAHGYNSLTHLFDTLDDHKTYSKKVWKSVISTEEQLTCYHLRVLDSAGKEHRIKIPYLLCYPSTAMAVLAEQGFTEIRQ